MNSHLELWYPWRRLVFKFGNWRKHYGIHSGLYWGIFAQKFFSSFSPHQVPASGRKFFQIFLKQLSGFLVLAWREKARAFALQDGASSDPSSDPAEQGEETVFSLPPLFGIHRAAIMRVTYCHRYNYLNTRT